MLRRIKPLNTQGVFKAKIEYKPDLMWVKIHQLRVNEEYQRKLGARSVNLIRRIVRGFSWSKYHPPVITQIGEEDGLPIYEVLDGQHTATAVASHGLLRELPCLIVATKDTHERADAFVGLNADKLVVTPLQVFWAKVAANDENALEVVEAAKEVGANILRTTPQYNIYQKGDCISVSNLLALAKVGGTHHVKAVLETGVLAELAPISRDFIIAFKKLLLGESTMRVKSPTARQDIALTIRRVGVDQLMSDAQRMYKGSGSTLGHCLAFQIHRYLSART